MPVHHLSLYQTMMQNKHAKKETEKTMMQKKHAKKEKKKTMMQNKHA